LYKHIVLLGDPHLPGSNLANKKHAIAEINTWKDVDLVTVLGDMCATTGTDKEYRYAKSFFSHLQQKTVFIVGNHDYVFKDLTGESQGYSLGSPQSCSKKLANYIKTFDVKDLYHSRKLGPFRLVFLSLDSLAGNYYAQLSAKQLQWLDWTLHQHPQEPTIIFCHAPVWGPEVLQISPKMAHFMIQPMAEVAGIIKKHRQVFLWAAGHVHFGAFNKMQQHPAMLFGGQVANIVACDIDGRSILQGSSLDLESHHNLWTRSLFLYEGRVEVKTYDHIKKEWIPELTKIIDVPDLSAR